MAGLASYLLFLDAPEGASQRRQVSLESLIKLAREYSVRAKQVLDGSTAVLALDPRVFMSEEVAATKSGSCGKVWTDDVERCEYDDSGD